MGYLLVTLSTIMALFFHWHYYKNYLFQRRGNRPPIYWSYKGALIAHTSKLFWFGMILLFMKWYFVFVPIVMLSILRVSIFFHALNALKKEYIDSGMKENEAKSLAKYRIKNLHK